MIELRKFQLRRVTCQSPVFNFEHASLALVARFKVTSQLAANLPLHSEWRDPVAFRRNSTLQGAHRHG